MALILNNGSLSKSRAGTLSVIRHNDRFLLLPDIRPAALCASAEAFRFGEILSHDFYIIGTEKRAAGPPDRPWELIFLHIFAGRGSRWHHSSISRPGGPYVRPNSETIGRAMGFTGRIYETGTAVPETGIYRVVHAAHRLPHEVVILKSQHFPKCQKCGEAVLFELLHAAPDLFRHTTVILYELPVIEEAEADAAQAG